MTTSRSTRSGCAAAHASPTAAPQSCMHSRTRSISSSSSSRSTNATWPGERVVEVPALAAAPEAGQVDGDPAAELERPEPVERRGRQAVQVEDRHRVASTSPARRRKTGWSSSSIVSSVTGGTAAEDSLSACGPSASARPSSISSASAPSPRSPKRTRSSRIREASAPTSPSPPLAREPPSRSPAARATTPGAPGCTTASKPSASASSGSGSRAASAPGWPSSPSTSTASRRYELHGDGIAATIAGLKRRLLDAVDEHRRAVLRLERPRRQGRGGARNDRPRARARARPAGRLRREHPARALGGLAAAAPARRAARACPARSSSSATRPRRA